MEYIKTCYKTVMAFSHIANEHESDVAFAIAKMGEESIKAFAFALCERALILPLQIFHALFGGYCVIQSTWFLSSVGAVKSVSSADSVFSCLNISKRNSESQNQLPIY